ncbi:hypothetical protein CSKR_107236 [Clonorchis sinensis]|uniref:Uncharacterized protein n=1 Tax=Clonorchis sinensis TaxID=79923 RepID=A0A419PCI2_CLOSI|nr:hypothetical protein CSKR_107236 [Clonorchis sinensis]
MIRMRRYEIIGFREIHSFAYQFGFCERLTWNPAESPVCDVSRQLNVLHQAASCSSCYDIRDIAIHQLEHEAAWCSTFSCLKTSQTGDSAGFQQLEHEAAWCSTFSCLKTSQTGDSAGF